MVKKAKGPKNIDDALGYLLGMVNNKKKAPHALCIRDVVYLNQKALLKNIQLLSDSVIDDFKKEVHRAMEEDDVDIRAARDFERQNVINMKVLSKAITDYIEECVEYSEEDWKLAE